MTTVIQYDSAQDVQKVIDMGLQAGLASTLERLDALRMKQQARFNPQFDEYQEAASDFAKPIMAHLRELVADAVSQFAPRSMVPDFGSKVNE